MTSKRFQQNMRTSFRKYWCHVVLCTTRNEVWNVTVSNSICFRLKSCVQLLKHNKQSYDLPILLQIDHSSNQEMAAAHCDIRESRHILYNNIDTKVCFIILWKPSSLGIPSSSLKKFDIFIG